MSSVRRTDWVVFDDRGCIHGLPCDVSGHHPHRAQYKTSDGKFYLCDVHIVLTPHQDKNKKRRLIRQEIVTKLREERKKLDGKA